VKKHSARPRLDLFWEVEEFARFFTQKKRRPDRLEMGKYFFCPGKRGKNGWLFSLFERYKPKAH
jgi:hypothetical protein